MIYWIIAISLLFSAFFSGMEIAFLSSNKLRFELDKKRQGLTSSIITIFYNNSEQFIATMLVGNNIALVIYGIEMADLLSPMLRLFISNDFAVNILQTIIATIIVLFTGEFLPKTLFKSNSNRLLAVFSVPAYLCYIILWPISRLSTSLSRLILGVFGVIIPKESEDEGFSKVDLGYLVQSSINNAKNDDEIDDEVKIFQNALDFPDTKVRDCMVPRTEINAVDLDGCTMDELMQKFIESGNSKILVYKEDIDHVIGYIHSVEMFRNPSDWRDNICTMPFVPETMAAQKLMQIFLQQKKSLGVVVDEFGGTSGIVSLEDIVEEIFGDIEDEHDNSKYIVKKIGNNEYVLSARLEIDKVNEMFGLDLPESDEYMTIGGLILHYYQSFPKLNEIVKVDCFEFKIVKNTMAKIELVELKVNV